VRSLGAAISFVTGTAVDLFYRRVVLHGEVPPTGPVLLVANHPNALLDPVVVLQSAGRRVRMLAKAPLFTMPGVSLLVKGMDCLPVYRSKDGADTKANDATFRAVDLALGNGDAVLIFPEGISHDEPTIQPLKTGAARMAISAVRNGADVVIVPVGLIYADKLRYRSTVMVDIGDPIVVADVVKGAAADDGDDDDDDRRAVAAVTSAVYTSLHQRTLNLHSWEDLRLIEAVDAIWRQRDPERVSRLKSLADGVALLRTTDPEVLDTFRQRLSAWVDHITALGLSPRDLGEEHVEAQKKPIRAAAFVVRQLAALWLLPIALAGAVFWAIPFWLTHLVYRLTGVERDTGATVKVLASLTFFPIFFVAAVVAIAVNVGVGAAVAVAVTAPAAGLVTRRFFRRRFFGLRQLFGALKLAATGSLGASVRAERDALCEQLDALGARVEALRASSSSSSSSPKASSKR